MEKHKKLIQQQFKNLLINLKNQLQHGMKNLTYQTDYILYEISKIIVSLSYKDMEKILIIHK